MEQSTIKINVVSASGLLYSLDASRVFIPCQEGEIGVLPKHTPFLSTLKQGELRIEKTNKEMLSVFVSGGIVEVQPEIVTILSDTAIRSQDLDEKKALQAKQNAEDTIANANANIDIAKAKLALVESVEQLKIIEKLKKDNRSVKL